MTSFTVHFIVAIGTDTHSKCEHFSLNRNCSGYLMCTSQSRLPCPPCILSRPLDTLSPLYHTCSDIVSHVLFAAVAFYVLISLGG